MSFLEKVTINARPTNIAEIESYKKLLKLCPTLAKLESGEFTEFTAKGKKTADLAIGCKTPENSEFLGLYEISSLHEGTRIFTTIEVSHKAKTANAIVFEKLRDNERKFVDAKETDPNKLSNLLSNLSRKGYKQENIQAAQSRG